MGNTKKAAKKRKRGRPATGRMPMFPLRIEASLMGEVDAWVRKEGLVISRSEALRRLVRAGLASMGRGGKR
jgi:hypothetical protein